MTLFNELNKAIDTPGDQKPEQANQAQRKTLRESMDLINYPIKTRQSSYGANPVTSKRQYRDIVVSKPKLKYWVSWKETKMQSIPHPPEDMAFKQLKSPSKTFESSPSSQE